MASPHVELVRSIHTAWARGDYSTADWADPDIEYVHADGPDSGSWRGLAGMAKAFGDFLGAWNELRVEAEEFRELDEERVLVLFSVTARGKQSGLDMGQISTRGAQLFHLNDGKVQRLVQYFNRENALDALGSSEQPEGEAEGDALTPFGALIGTWDTEATHPLFDGVVSGTATFEWLEGGKFLVMRSGNDHDLFPDAISIVGAPEAGDGLVMEYFDSRGVRRTYGIALEDEVLRIWRDAPGFDQRFSATLADDCFEGLWQLAESPGDWKDDLHMTYRRSEEP